MNKYEKLTDYGNILFDILLLNFMWILGSVTIIGIGASNAALCYVTGKMLRKEEYSILKDFIHSYKINFMQTMVISIIFGTLYAWSIYSIKIILETGLSKWLILIFVLFIVELTAIQVYLYPMISRYTIKTLNLFIVSIYMANTKIIESIISITIMLIILYISIHIPVVIFLVSFSSMGVANYMIVKSQIDNIKNNQTKNRRRLDVKKESENP